MRKLIIGIVILAFLGGIGYRVHQIVRFKKMMGWKVEEIAEVPVRVEGVKLETIEDKISLTGNIEPQSQVVVYSKVGGEIENLAVDIGDKVKKGDLIAQIENRKLVLQVKRLEASLEAAEINLANLKKDYERIKNLYEKNAVSRQKMDDVTTAYESSQAQVKELKATLALAKIQVADSTVSAPIGGIIAQKFVEEGDVVTPTSQMKGAPLVVIVDMDRVKVVVNVIEKDIARVKIGQEARVELDAYPDKSFRGKVSNISPVVDPLSRTASVEIEVPNPERLLKPGMFARVEIIVREKKDALQVRKEALIKGDKVFVAEGEKASLRQVRVGIKEGEWVEILSGLREGDKVVVRGQQFLKDGMRIKVVEE